MYFITSVYHTLIFINELRLIGERAILDIPHVNYHETKGVINNNSWSFVILILDVVLVHRFQTGV